MVDIKEILLQRFISFLTKKYADGPLRRANKSVIKTEIVLNQELAEELHRQINKRFKKQKVHSSFKDNIWDAVLPDTQLLSK